MLEVEPRSVKSILFGDGNVLSEEVTNELSSALKGRTDLMDNEKRLLGQLAVIAFTTTSEAESLAFLNFYKCQKIHIARVPRQYKQDEASTSAMLHAIHVLTVKRWMKHLPSKYYKPVIAAFSLEINVESAVDVLAKYHNKNLRLNANDSCALKNFVGLNDAQYVRLMRSLFYFVGMCVCSPLRAIYRL